MTGLHDQRVVGPLLSRPPTPGRIVARGAPKDPGTFGRPIPGGAGGLCTGAVASARAGVSVGRSGVRQSPLSVQDTIFPRRLSLPGS
jgi:hypothetical protein